MSDTSEKEWNLLEADKTELQCPSGSLKDVSDWAADFVTNELAAEIVDSEEVGGEIACTNADGWGVNQFCVELVELKPKYDGVCIGHSVRIVGDAYLDGDHDEDKMYSGNSMTAKVEVRMTVAVDDSVRAVEWRVLSVEVNSDDPDGEDDDFGDDFDPEADDFDPEGVKVVGECQMPVSDGMGGTKPCGKPLEARLSEHEESGGVRAVPGEGGARYYSKGMPPREDADEGEAWRG